MVCVEKSGEGLRQFGGLDFAVLVDEELLEEALVDLAFDVVWGGEVGLLAVGGGSESTGERGFEVGGGGFGGGDLHVGFGERPREPLHLSGEQIGWNGAGVVGLHELQSFVLKLGFALHGASHAAFSFVLLGGEFSTNAGLDDFNPLRADVEPGVVGSDTVFDAL